MWVGRGRGGSKGQPPPNNFENVLRSLPPPMAPNNPANTKACPHPNIENLPTPVAIMTELRHKRNIFMPYVNKGTDQPVHPRSLIRTLR